MDPIIENQPPTPPLLTPNRFALLLTICGILLGVSTTAVINWLWQETEVPTFSAPEIHALMAQPKFEITSSGQLERSTESSNSPTRTIASEMHIEKLSAPTHLTPAKLADLRKNANVTLRWNSVDGASAYFVRVWQFHDHKQVIVVNEKVETTDFAMIPPYAGPVHWQISAISKSGEPGETSAPSTFDVIR